MSLIITRITSSNAPEGDLLTLVYDRPDRPPGHIHYVPIAAIENRMALYGISTMEEALEECIIESLVESQFIPTKAERLSARSDHGAVVGLTTNLARAGVKLVAPSKEYQNKIQEQAARGLGISAYAAIRGVDKSSLVDLLPPQANGLFFKSKETT